MTLTPDQIAKIKARAEAATPGEWEHCDICDRAGDEGVPGVTAFRQNEECIIALADRKSEQPEQNSADMVFIARAREDIPALVASHESLEERVKVLEARLTPSLETKAALMGKFSILFPGVDDDGEEHMRQINVPWTTIKEIMAAIRALGAKP
jgi:hypothetical protein